ncbi:MAG: acetyltransferase [Oceanospirillaceae bacterium]|nr:acetyltransferase [Oceanospirillaceae bacterium]
MNNKVVLIGLGGHAKVILAMAKEKKISIDAIATRDFNPEKEFCGIPLISDEELTKYPIENTSLINGIGAIPNQSNHKEIFLSFRSLGFSFLTLISDHAWVDESVTLKEGSIVMAGAIVQASTVIAENVIVNTGAIIDHDCYIGSHTHICPGVTVCGGVSISENVFIGAGSVIIPNLEIGSDSMIAAGCTIYKSVSDWSKIVSTASMRIM